MKDYIICILACVILWVIWMSFGLLVQFLFSVDFNVACLISVPIVIIGEIIVTRKLT